MQQEFRRHRWTGRGAGHNAWYHQVSEWFHASNSHHGIWGIIIIYYLYPSCGCSCQLQSWHTHHYCRLEESRFLISNSEPAQVTSLWQKDTGWEVAVIKHKWPNFSWATCAGGGSRWTWQQDAALLSNGFDTDICKWEDADLTGPE